MIITVDIDGVLADVREYVQAHLLGSEKRDWKTYLSHTTEFPVIKPLRLIVRAWTWNPTHDIYIVTGRPDSNRSDTIRWLQENVLGGVGFHFPDRLLMRRNGETRPTWEVKLERFRELKPDLVVDDDPVVVKAAVEAGFTVLQVHGYRVTDTDFTPE